MGLNRAPLILHLSVAAAALWTCPAIGWTASANGRAEYLGGTVRVVQPSARGTLEFGEGLELVFQSKDSVLRLPYDRISDFHFSEYRKHGRKVVGVRLPAISMLMHDQVLELSFHQQDGSLGTASFRVDERTRSAAEPLLLDRIALDKKTPKRAAGIKLTEEWWGDKNWKTTRNMAAWPEPPAEVPPVLARVK